MRENQDTTGWTLALSLNKPVFPTDSATPSISVHLPKNQETQKHKINHNKSIYYSPNSLIYAFILLQ